jgi:hypothetical protein
MVGTLATLVPPSLLAATSVTLAWNPSAGANIAGYKIYYGAASLTYTNTTDVGNLTNATVGNLISGATYFFAATAYDASGLESDYSTEVAYTNLAVVPPTIVLSSPASGGIYAAPATINLAASVTANGHSITKVQFYNGSTLITEETAAPYSFAWNSVDAGSYSLTAQAVYDSGSTVATTPAVNVLVAAARPANTSPAISAIADQSMTTNGTQRLIRFTISETGTAASNLSLYASSTNTALLPINNIVFAGSDTNRTATLTPVSGQIGQADVTITVSDGSVSTNLTFHLSVTEQVAWNLWWQNVNGTTAAWSLSNTNQLVASGLLSPTTPGAGWKVVGAADFNGDGGQDLVLRNVDGRVAAWFMNGLTCTQTVTLTPSQVDPSWKIVGTGDFNGDGQTDLLWENDNGRLAIWFMNGTTLVSSTLLTPSQVSPGWKVVATGDFNGDGQTDIVWESDTGRLAVWFMNGTTLVNSTLLTPGQVDPSWRIVGATDINGDGRPDLLWQHSSGVLAYWLMNGSDLIGNGLLKPSQVDPSWKVVGHK